MTETKITIRTRFPPEPNGYLHIGHAKSAYLNWGYPFEWSDAERDAHKECYLRFDDTNPNAEKTDYIDSILRDIDWMGFVPDKVTYTSDYFDTIYEKTLDMITKGYAYIDSSTSEEIRQMRHEKIESPYREKYTVEENIALFEDMKNGKYEEGKAVLRLKIPEEDRTNDCMIDPIAYRIIHKEHHRTGNKWIIYPTYEYSHYIVDSLEGITHSFCTMEFYVRRPLSLWILNKLEMKAPIIDETNRLVTNFGILSKRKIKKLIEDGHMEDWNDPRLLTIAGIRNRGITPSMLKEFCAKLGYTRRATAVTPYHVLENVIRNWSNENAPRHMAVFDPVEVVIMNYDDFTEEELNLHNDIIT